MTTTATAIRAATPAKAVAALTVSMIETYVTDEGDYLNASEKLHASFAVLSRAVAPLLDGKGEPKNKAVFKVAFVTPYKAAIMAQRKVSDAAARKALSRLMGDIRLGTYGATLAAERKAAKAAAKLAAQKATEAAIAKAKLAMAKETGAAPAPVTTGEAAPAANATPQSVVGRGGRTALESLPGNAEPATLVVDGPLVAVGNDAQRITALRNTHARMLAFAPKLRALNDAAQKEYTAMVADVARVIALYAVSK